MAASESTTRPEAVAFGTARGRWVIAAAVLGSGVASLDATVVNISLPAIGRSFHTGLGTLQWVLTGYSLTLAAFLLLGGSLGDRHGRRRVFAVGVVWFAAASALCGLAPSSQVLVGARVLQGIGGALLTPASLAILEASFRPEDRARAIGAWSGLGGLASAAGPLVGGYLLAAGSWRYVFFVNLPVAAGVLWVTARHVPESRRAAAGGRLDAGGAALAVVTLGGLTYGLIEGPTAGWGAPLVVAGLAVAGLGAPAFLLLERRQADPMLPLEMFKHRQFAAANAVTFVVYGALGGSLFLLPVALQTVDGYSPLSSGLALLPVTALMLVFSPRSAALAARIGPRLQMSAGPVVAGAGLLLLVRAVDGSSYVTFVLPAVACFGAGLAITVAPLTSTAMQAAPGDHAGAASAVNNVVARAAGLLAVAVLPVLAGLAGARSLSSHAFAAGYRSAMVIAGCTCIAGGLLAAWSIRNPGEGKGAARPRRWPARRWHCALDGPPLDAPGSRPLRATGGPAHDRTDGKGGASRCSRRPS
ncbi:MFS transporter [Acidiferrimicrobium sp. IK]|uniref:MFS transporter n=1 Tax=Acidiferrimicrobium sp. IK TaxID=2871700 RepID=UPI0021CB4B1F|nr:MFS transporter [Acidiferrimicrobium sp. IK]MCU4183390.1 MFS transporter [Acidiferrimicrobium sp. IK]